MKKQVYYFAAWFVGITPVLSYAAVQLDIKTNNQNETFWSDGKHLHVQSGEDPAYILVYPDQRQLFTIDHAQKQVIDLSEKITQAPTMPPPEEYSIEYIHHGAGPKILGFDTEFYLLKVNGEVCMSEYLSKSLNKLSDVISSMELMTEYRINTTFGNLPPQLDLCFVAEHIAYQRYREHGFPLRTEDQFGKVQFELLKINEAADNPKENFKLPEGFTVITYEQMMESSNMIPLEPQGDMHPSEVIELMKKH